MTDENTPRREQVDRSGYAFNMAVAEAIVRSSTRQRWTCVGNEVPWSTRLGKEKGFIDTVIKRDRAVGVIECKKVNNGDSLIFLTRHDHNAHETRCRLPIYFQEVDEEDGSRQFSLAPPMIATFKDRFITAECNMVTGSPESAYCVAPKGKQTANLNLDSIASDLLTSCDGLLGDWGLDLHAKAVACVPIVVTNARIMTCSFDPGEIDLESGSVPTDAQFQSQQFVRFRKAFQHGIGLDQATSKQLEDVVPESERTVFVVDSQHLVPFLAGLRSLTTLSDDQEVQFVAG